MCIKTFGRIPWLSLRIFLLITVCVLLPMYAVFLLLRMQFESYIQNELSNQVIQSISKSEQEIYQELKSMAAISSVVISNVTFSDALQDDSLSFYQKTIVFDTVLANLSANSLFTMEDVKISFFDLDNRFYSNWDINYHDYKFLLEQEWVQQSIGMGGHISWNMFSPGYIISTSHKGSDKYISLARSMLSQGVTGKRLGTIIISIEQRLFSNILEKYSYNENDCIYVCVENGEILLRMDNKTDVQAQVRRAFLNMKADSGSIVEELDGKQYLVSYYTIPQPWTFNGQRLRVLHYTDYAGILEQVKQFSISIQIGMLLFSILLVLVAGLISVRIVKPIQSLERHMQDYSVNTKIMGLDTERTDEIGSLNRAFIKMGQHINNLFASLTKAHKVREKYRFESLRAQLNPHFLFNALGTIRWMAIMRGADNMVQSIDALAGVLKYAMARGGEMVRLCDELQSVRDYIYIQNTRYGDYCNLKVNIDPELQNLYVVKFILQPIVENCILHGLKEIGHRGQIYIWAELQEEKLLVYIEDNGKGIAPNILEQLNYSHNTLGNKQMTGIGFSHVRERIRTVYGEPFDLSIASEVDSYTCVTYTLPAIRDLPAEDKSEIDVFPCQKEKI